MGIIVQYKVKIRLLIAGALGGELSAELPFTLTHPKPVETPLLPFESKKAIPNAQSNSTAHQEGPKNGENGQREERGGGDENETADVDLIQFDR